MRVITKAYADKPLDRTAVERQGRLIYVVDVSTPHSINADGQGGVGFPCNCVFEFDEGLFEKLDTAFKSGETGSLHRLWSEAVPITYGKQLVSRG